MPKIRALRAEIDRRGLDIDIQVDGGINPTTVATVVEAGANVLVAGYGVYRAPNHDYAAAIATLRAAAASVAIRPPRPRRSLRGRALALSESACPHPALSARARPLARFALTPTLSRKREREDDPARGAGAAFLARSMR